MGSNAIVEYLPFNLLRTTLIIPENKYAIAISENEPCGVFSGMTVQQSSLSGKKIPDGLLIIPKNANLEANLIAYSKERYAVPTNVRFEINIPGKDEASTFAKWAMSENKLLTATELADLLTPELTAPVRQILVNYAVEELSVLSAQKVTEDLERNNIADKSAEIRKTYGLSINTISLNINYQYLKFQIARKFFELELKKDHTDIDHRELDRYANQFELLDAASKGKKLSLEDKSYLRQLVHQQDVRVTKKEIARPIVAQLKTELQSYISAKTMPCSEAYFLQAMLNIPQEDYTGAINAFNQGLKSKKDASAFYFRGKCFIWSDPTKLGNLKNAASDLKNAFELGYMVPQQEIRDIEYRIGVLKR